jgi:hypothetical protein
MRLRERESVLEIRREKLLRVEVSHEMRSRTLHERRDDEMRNLRRRSGGRTMRMLALSIVRGL